MGGKLWVRQTGVSDFSGLAALTTCGEFSVAENSQLVGFAGLSTFESVGGNLAIVSNPALSPTVAQTFVNGITVHGTTTIQ
jgi:hypothetical protein